MDAPCSPSLVERAPKPPPAERLVRTCEYERQVLGRTNTARCMAIWTNLRGAASDFDDLSFAVAEALGWRRGPGRDFVDDLNAVCEVADQAQWSTVRHIAVDVFMEVYAAPDRVVYESAELDWRSWDEIVDDAQFGTDGCPLCAIEVPADLDSPETHRRVASAVACGRVCWSDVPGLSRDGRVAAPAP